MVKQLQTGDLVEFLETIYPKVHKLQRGIIVHQNGAIGELKLFKVVTTENESVWVYGTDLRRIEEEEC